MERVPKLPIVIEIEAMEREEMEHIRRGNHARVFYHPGMSSNAVMTGDGAKKIKTAPGYRLDVEVWEANGRRGAAPQVPLDFPSELESEPVFGEWVPPTVEEALALVPKRRKKN
jgi:hypothetical protein